MKTRQSLLILLILPIFSFAEIGGTCKQMETQYSLASQDLENSNYWLKNKYPFFYHFMSGCENTSDPEGCLASNCIISAGIQIIFGENATCDNFIIDAYKVKNYQDGIKFKMAQLETTYNAKRCQ